MRPNVRRLMIALVLGGIAALLLVSYLQEVERRVIMEVSPEFILVAKKDIPARSIITDDMLEYQEIPKPFIQPGVVTRVEEIIGLVAITDIKKGTQITKSLLLPPTLWTVLSSFIPEGYRAITLYVDEVSGVGGLILPGDEVDVVATFSYDDLKAHVSERDLRRFLSYRLRGTSFSTITYRGLRVLAVGKNILTLPPTVKEQKGMFDIGGIGEVERVSSVTLAVPKEIARELALLSQIASIRLVLRSVKEVKLPGEDTLREEPLTVVDLLNKLRPERKVYKKKKSYVKKKPSYYYIDVYRRTELEKIKVSSTGRILSKQKPWESKAEEKELAEKYMSTIFKNLQSMLKKQPQLPTQFPGMPFNLPQMNVPCDTC